MLRQAFGQKHRTMLAASAADCHGQVRTVVAQVSRQPVAQEAAQIGFHLEHLGLGFKETNDLRVAPGLCAQHRIVMRIGQAAHVEHQIGIERQAVLEAERLEQQRQAAALIEFGKILDAGTQRIGAQIAGVNVMPETGEHLQRPALTRNRFVQRAIVIGQRVAATGFGETLDQHFIAGIKEDETQHDTVGLDQTQLRRQRRDTRPTAHIDGHRHLRVTLGAQMLHQLRQQRRGQIVDAVIARVLKDIERDRLAGTGKAADEYQLHKAKDSGSAAKVHGSAHDRILLALFRKFDDVPLSMLKHLSAHPLWLVGFRPLFALGCLAGLFLPLAWALMFSGTVPSPSTFALPGAQWHAHEMFFGFGLAVLGGFLLTASKNWVAIRGYHGLALLLLTAAWLLDRLLMSVGAALPKPVFFFGSSLFTAALVAMLLATLLRHRRSDSYADNLYFILALPFLLPAKWLLFSDTQFSAGVTMSLAIFRLSFLIMLERTLTQFMRALFKAEILRAPWLDHAIKSLGLLLIAAPWLPVPLAGAVSGLLGLLLAGRWLCWHPWQALRRIDVGIMYVGQLAIILQLLLEGVHGFVPLTWVGTLSVHLFTLGVMGLIVPAMMVRIARGHTGRKVLFDAQDKLVLWLMLAGLLLRVALPQLFPETYTLWIIASALCWLGGFGLLAWRYIPWLLAARVDGKMH